MAMIEESRACVTANCAFSDSLPPFLYADESNVAKVLLSLAGDVELTRKIQQQSFDYFDSYMTFDKLIRNFTNVYK